jgi:hypothetical protein
MVFELYRVTAMSDVSDWARCGAEFGRPSSSWGGLVSMRPDPLNATSGRGPTSARNHDGGGTPERRVRPVATGTVLGSVLDVEPDRLARLDGNGHAVLR